MTREEYNNVDIVEGGQYKIQNTIIDSDFSNDIFLIKLVKIKKRKFLFNVVYVDGVVYSNHKDGTLEKIMTLEKFNKNVLYKVN